MKHYKLSEVVTEISERVNNPATSGYSRFVGLEHYVSGDVEITKYGSTEKLESAMKVFHSGDILIARRNVYLRRASVVLFDGLTSGDSIVLRAKDEQIARLLPFVFNTDSFWDFADTHADGTMSKRLSPKTLMQYEFDLPDEDKQEELANLLWAANEVRNRYRDLLIHTDELVKSQFIGMFEMENSNWPCVSIENISTSLRTGPFGSALKHGEFVDSGVFVLGIDNAVENSFSYKKMRYITEEKYAQLKRYTVYPNDVIITLMGTVGRTAVVPEDIATAINTKHLACISLDKDRANPYFVAYALREHNGILTQLQAQKKGAIMEGLNLTIIKNLSLSLPPIELQQRFVEILKLADKSKFELKQSIERVTALMKSLMPQG